jgi:hypothetical protein
MSVVRPKNQYSLTGCGMMERFRLAALGALIILFAASLFPGAVEFAAAQDIFGRIAGTVTDTSGATVPDAKVAIVNEATQITRDVTTDEHGYFVADQLPVGTYSVVVEKGGFKKSTK